ncbi:MAG: hypothetical protein GF418_11680 [Chitinivibrionales bacterium]|nr:hypothetical protein [Chitinivibrionales bacterium]MBD3396276.1 hypothetical protein [Chitinivibrionales bacterium]
MATTSIDFGQKGNTMAGNTVQVGWDGKGWMAGALPESLAKPEDSMDQVLFANLVAAAVASVNYETPHSTARALEGPTQPVLASLHRALTSSSYRIAKPVLDILLVMITLPVWLPLCCALALLIWLEDRHAPLYFQIRIGWNGRPFRVWKFRTMVPNAEDLLERMLLLDPEIRREWRARYKLRHDPRVTRAGRFIRRFSLDELPQLINVLQGHMSLVGPRPLPRYHHRKLGDHVCAYREAVRPGLTGLWQVSCRSDGGNNGMRLWDPFYVRNWSLILDLLILARTARVVLKGRGAY